MKKAAAPGRLGPVVLRRRRRRTTAQATLAELDLFGGVRASGWERARAPEELEIPDIHDVTSVECSWGRRARAADQAARVGQEGECSGYATP